MYYRAVLAQGRKVGYEIFSFKKSQLSLSATNTNRVSLNNEAEAVDLKLTIVSIPLLLPNESQELFEKPSLSVVVDDKNPVRGSTLADSSQQQFRSAPLPPSCSVQLWSTSRLVERLLQTPLNIQPRQI